MITEVADAFWGRLSLRPPREVLNTATRVVELPLAGGEVAMPVPIPDTEVDRGGVALNRMLGHVGNAPARRQAHSRRSRTFARLWVAWLVINADGKITDAEGLLFQQLTRLARERHQVDDEQLANRIVRPKRDRRGSRPCPEHLIGAATLNVPLPRRTYLAPRRGRSVVRPSRPRR